MPLKAGIFYIWRLTFLRFRVKDAYILKLVFLRLGVSNCYV